MPFAIKAPRGDVLIREIPTTMTDDTYGIYVYGEARTDGTWEGWIEFIPVSGGSTLRTDRETSQPNLAALEYWAYGLEPVYFEGALARAQGRLL
jgi:hypothetical protein